MQVLLSIRRRFGLSQHKMALKINNESGHHITRGYVSVLERGKANAPIWLLVWMQKYTAEPVVILVPACPSCGAAHAVVDCHCQPGAPAWRQPHGPRGVIQEDWLARYRAVVPRPEIPDGPS